jgi:hypothetical protein
MAHPEPLDEAIEAIRRRWRFEGTAFRPGASDDAMAAFERRHAVRLPSAMRRFYAATNGTADDHFDPNVTAFWPVSEIVSVPEGCAGRGHLRYEDGLDRTLPDAASCFLFADVLIWSHVYTVRLTPDPDAPGPVIGILDAETWWTIAPSFEGFLRAYLRDPQALALGFTEFDAHGRPLPDRQ